jgi:hypothetical protein
VTTITVLKIMMCKNALVAAIERYDNKRSDFMSKSNQAEFGSDIRLLQEHEISDVNGGFFIAAIICAELFTLGALAGYVIADQRLPSQFREF